MNAVLEENIIDDIAQEDGEYISHEEVMRISDRLLEKHRKAYTALASCEDINSFSGLEL